jgi:hypothetical protein
VRVKTPREVVNRLNRETVKVLAMPDTKERFAKMAQSPWP